jgi:hypothetical protein
MKVMLVSESLRALVQHAVVRLLSGTKSMPLLLRQKLVLANLPATRFQRVPRAILPLVLHDDLHHDQIKTELAFPARLLLASVES